MDTKSGCGRLDLSAFQAEPARPAWPVSSDEAALAEATSWRPIEMDRLVLARLFEPRPN